MNEITIAITEIKSKVSMDEWKQRIIDCRNSGKGIKAWCRENGVRIIEMFFKNIKNNSLAPHHGIMQSFTVCSAGNIRNQSIFVWISQ